MKKFIWILIAILVIAGIVYLQKAPDRPGRLDTFATCINESGATFFGAFWCPHCQNQKADFGSSAKYLPYQECSTPDGSGQLQVCDDAGIEGYPTWEFADGTREGGVLSLERLSELTSCPLPEEDAN